MCFMVVMLANFIWSTHPIWVNWLHPNHVPSQQEVVGKVHQIHHGQLCQQPQSRHVLNVWSNVWNCSSPAMLVWSIGDAQTLLKCSKSLLKPKWQKTAHLSEQAQDDSHLVSTFLFDHTMTTTLHMAHLSLKWGGIWSCQTMWLSIYTTPMFMPISEAGRNEGATSSNATTATTTTQTHKLIRICQQHQQWLWH